MALDFNSDDVIQTSKVASGMGDFFPEGGMRASDYRSMQANYAQNIAPLQDRMMTMQNNMMRLQAQDMAFKTSALAFKDAKEKQELQRQYNDPAFLDRIDAILDSDAPPLEQRNQIQDLGRKNPQALLNVPLIAQAYNTALNQTKTRADIEAKEGKLEEGVSTLANRLLQLPSPEANVAGGKLLRGEMTFDEGIDVLSGEKKNIDQLKKAEEFQDAKKKQLQSDTAFAQGLSVTESSFEDVLPTLSDDVQNQWDQISATGDAGAKAAFMAQNKIPARFKSLDRQRLVENLARSTSMTEKEIEEKYPESDPNSDMEMFKEYRKSLRFRRNDLYGGDVDDERLDLTDTRAERDIRRAMLPAPE